MSVGEIRKEDAAILEKNLRTISTRIRREGRKVLRDFPITPAQLMSFRCFSLTERNG